MPSEVRRGASGRETVPGFRAAGAAVEITDAGDLGRALAETLQPDRAAEMAAAGWETCSAGAGVTDLVLEAVGGYLDRSA